MPFSSRQPGGGGGTILRSIVCGADSIMRGPLAPFTEGGLRCPLSASLPASVEFKGDQPNGVCVQNLHVGSPADPPITGPGQSWRVQDAVAALPVWQAAFNPTLYLMMVGINNLAPGPLQETPAAVAARLIAFRNMRDNILLCGITKVANGALQALVDQCNALFNPDALTNLVNVTWIDGIHPDPASAILLAPPCHTAIVNWLNAN